MSQSEGRRQVIHLAGALIRSWILHWANYCTFCRVACCLSDILIAAGIIQRPQWHARSRERKMKEAHKSRSRNCYLARAQNASALPCNINVQARSRLALHEWPAGNSTERSLREGDEEHGLTDVIVDDHAIITISVPCTGRKPTQPQPCPTVPSQLAVAQKSSQGKGEWLQHQQQRTCSVLRPATPRRPMLPQAQPTLSSLLKGPSKAGLHHSPQLHPLLPGHFLECWRTQWTRLPHEGGSTGQRREKGAWSQAGSRTWPVAAAPVAGLVPAPAAAPGGQDRNGDRYQNGLREGVVLPLVVIPCELSRSGSASQCKGACCCNVIKPGRSCQRLRPSPSSSPGQLPACNRASLASCTKHGITIWSRSGCCVLDLL